MTLQYNVRKRILLKYQKPQNYGNDKSNWQYVALDSHSGGYPYATDVLSAHDFKTVEEARKYRGHFEEFDIVEVSISVEETILEKYVKLVRYAVLTLQHEKDIYRVMDNKMHKEVAKFFDRQLADEYVKTLNAK